MARSSPAQSRATPFDAWPAADRSSWHRATSPGTALGDAGLGAGWRPDTRERYLWAYGHWLTFLRYHDLMNAVATPADRVTRPAVTAFIESLKERNLASRTIASYMQALHNALRAMAPEHDWSWLGEIVNFLIRISEPKPVDTSRIHAIDDVYGAALRFMDRAGRMIPKRPLQDSIWFRDGLLVAVGAATALRRKNLALLELDRHLIRQHEGWWLAICGDEVKNGMPIDGPLHTSLTPYLDRYIANHRPRLLNGRSHSALFVRYTGDPFTRNTLSGRMIKITKRLGFPMSCHDLRTSAATTIAEKHPEFAWIIGPVLGHNGLRTGERYYNKAAMILSSRRHGDTIATLKASLGDLISDPA